MEIFHSQEHFSKVWTVVLTFRNRADDPVDRGPQGNKSSSEIDVAQGCPLFGHPVASVRRLLPQRDADGVSGSGAGFGENMRVHVFRGLGAAVSEMVGNHPDGKPRVYQERRCRVTDVVDMQVR